MHTEIFMDEKICYLGSLQNNSFGTGERVGYKQNKIVHELIIAKAGWWIHGSSLYYSLYLVYFRIFRFKKCFKSMEEYNIHKTYNRKKLVYMAVPHDWQTLLPSQTPHSSGDPNDSINAKIPLS